MHPSTRFLTAITIAALAAAPAITQQRLGHIGQQYLQENGAWVQLDPNGERFEINPRVISVKFLETASRSAQDSLIGRLDTTELRRASTGFVDIAVPPTKDVFQVIDAYIASGSVEIAEPTTFGRYTVIPDDTDWGSQSWLPLIDAPEAWDIETGNPSAVVAVLDSGTEFSHEDLGPGTDGYSNVWLNSGEDAWSSPDNPATGNGVDDDMNGYVDDWKGYDFSTDNNDSEGSFFHGTAVAGAVAAKTNNGQGVAGVAGGFDGPGAQIMIAGVGDTAPNGSVIDDAILYAVAHGARVVQLSLTVGASAAIDAAADDAYDNGNMVIICASGNSGSTSVGYPSSHPKIIAVGATNTSDNRASFSQHGPLVEVSAPGTSFYTLDLNDTYNFTSGTSFAAPTVSGVVALMLSVNPSLTNVEIRQILRDTADKVGGYDYNWDAGMPGHSFELGYGRVNAEAAVTAAGAAGGPLFTDGFESGDTSNWL